MSRSFKDSQGREWILPALSVDDLSRVKDAGGVDLYAVVQGKGQVDDDIGKLVKTFRVLMSDQLRAHCSTEAGIARFFREEFDGDFIPAFRSAVEGALIRFFPSISRAAAEVVARARAAMLIGRRTSTNSADSPAQTPEA
jgi:hypothetical protein